MIISTFSYLWASSAADAIAELVEEGYESFEVPISSPHCWPDELPAADRARLREQLTERGAVIRSLNAGGYDLNLASPAANVRRRSIEHVTAVLELAGEWGAQEVVISPGTRRPMISPPLDRTYAWMYESMDVLAGRADATGARLLLENTPYCFTPTIGELAEVVRVVDQDAVKIVYDIANAAYIGEDPVAGLLAHRESIALVHVSDTGTDVWGHDPIGTGVVDFAALGAAVDETCGVQSAVLEIIREKRPLQEFRTAIEALRAEDWSLAR